MRTSCGPSARISPAAPVDIDEQPPRLSSCNSDAETATEAAAEPFEIPNQPSAAAPPPSRARSWQFSRLDSRRLAAPAELVRQASKSIYGSAREYGSARFSSVRTLSFAELERRSSRYYKNNSLAFGQVVAVDHDDIGESLFDVEEQDGLEVHDPEVSAEKRSQDPIQIQKFESVQWQDTQITIAGGLQKQPSATTKALSTGRKSRLRTIILEQSWFTVYKRLNLATLVLNLIGLVLAGSGHFPYAKSDAVVFSLGNVMMCVLVRNEVFLRVLFWLAVHVLGYWWIPVKLKTMMTAQLQSVGGIHSGCGMGAVMWLAYALAQGFQNRQTASVAMLGVACGILFLLVLSSLAAFPVFRHIHHNFFEMVHRFAGWTSLALVWVYVILDAFWDPVIKSYRISDRSGKELVEMQGLWLTVATTFMIILPWLGVRRVAVDTVVPDTKLNTLLHFEGGVGAGLLGRISPSPFSEWHAFGIISDGHRRHFILAGVVGDFTKSLAERPPTHIWVRAFHFAGLPYLIKMYQRALLVCTGSGMGVFLSFLLQPNKTDVHIIWIAKNIRASYGDGIWEAINDASAEKLTVIDTAVSGRPKTRELVVTKAKEWRAEVVVVTSNPSGTNEIVNACKAAGIPAFGPIWDS